MIIDLDPEISALAKRLESEGWQFDLTLTYSGAGFILVARRINSDSTLPLLREALTESLKAKCFTQPDGVKRVRLHAVAKFCKASPRGIAKMLRDRGLNMVSVGGVTWVVYDAAWMNFLELKRTPVLKGKKNESEHQRIEQSKRTTVND
jgi:hypothetical protein